MSRRLAALVAVLACVAAVGVFAGAPVGPVEPAAGAQSLVVSNVTISPDTPTPGEPVTVHATVENPAGNAQSLSVVAVALRNEGNDGLPEYDRARDLGRLDPGSKIEVPLTRTFDAPGTYQMRVLAYSNGQPSTVRRPVQVRVQEPSAAEPKVDLATDGLTAGTESELNLTVANSLRNDFVGAEITLDGENLSVADGHRVFAEIARGSKETVGFDVTPTKAGTVTAEATITYTTDEGGHTATEHFDLAVEEAAPSLALDARSVTENGSTVIETTITNAGNTPVRNLELGTPSSNVSVGTALVETVAAGEQHTVDIEVGAVDGSGKRTVPLVASYETAGQQSTAETSVDVTTNPGSIRLTGLRVEPQGSTMHVSGSTSNVGLSDANAVLVEVVDTANVTPAGPNRNYFVGAVPANEFVTFDVYAQRTGSATAIPLRIEYIVDGDRDSRIVEVPISSGGPGAAPGGANPGENAESGVEAGEDDGSGAAQPGAQPGTDDGVGAGPLAFGAVIVGSLGAIMLRGWRRSRGRD